jgi:hypothetical protein
MMHGVVIMLFFNEYVTAFKPLRTDIELSNKSKFSSILFQNHHQTNCLHQIYRVLYAVNDIMHTGHYYNGGSCW